MQRFQPKMIVPQLCRPVLAVAVVGALTATMGPRAAGEEPGAYTVEVSDVTAKVGETTVLLATLRPREGYKILHHYNNRVGQLSSWDEGVAFEHKVFQALDENDALIFEIRVTPVTSGTHPINGVFRVGYVEPGTGLSMVSVPLMAKITGTD
ncbi:MAG TPA: hypothetical protein VGM32_07980 [Rhodopila sp.]|jgi:hypothetical protein